MISPHREIIKEMNEFTFFFLFTHHITWKYTYYACESVILNALHIEGKRFRAIHNIYAQALFCCVTHTPIIRVLHFSPAKTVDLCFSTAG